MGTKLNRGKLQGAGIVNTSRGIGQQFVGDDFENLPEVKIPSDDTWEGVKARFNNAVIDMHEASLRQVVTSNGAPQKVLLDSMWTGSGGTASGYGWILPLVPANMPNNTSTNDEFTNKVVMYYSTPNVSTSSTDLDYQGVAVDTYNSFGGQTESTLPLSGSWTTPNDNFHIDRIQCEISIVDADILSEHDAHEYKISVYAGAARNTGYLNFLSLSYGGDNTNMWPKIDRTSGTGYNLLSLREAPRAPLTNINGEESAVATITFLSATKADYDGKYITIGNTGEKFTKFTFEDSVNTIARVDSEAITVGLLDCTTVQHIVDQFQEAIYVANYGYLGMTPDITVHSVELDGACTGGAINLQANIPGERGNYPIFSDVPIDKMTFTSFDGGVEPDPEKSIGIKNYIGSDYPILHHYLRGGRNWPGSNFMLDIPEGTDIGYFDNMSKGGFVTSASLSLWPIMIARGPNITFGTIGPSNHYFIDIPLHTTFSSRGIPIYLIFEPITHESDTNASGWSGSTPMYVQTYILGGEIKGE